jgi:hypothetical protein
VPKNESARLPTPGAPTSSRATRDASSNYDGSFAGGGVGRPPPEDDDPDEDDPEDDGGGELRDDSTCGAGALRGPSVLGDSTRGDSVLGDGDAPRGL